MAAWFELKVISAEPDPSGLRTNPMPLFGNAEDTHPWATDLIFQTLKDGKAPLKKVEAIIPGSPSPPGVVHELVPS